ncbi:MAG: hypothetical protein U0X75_05850 [Acidobacteriota bacterium]
MGTALGNALDGIFLPGRITRQFATANLSLQTQRHYRLANTNTQYTFAQPDYPTALGIDLHLITGNPVLGDAE